MRETTKKQPYTYSAMTGALGGMLICSRRIYLFLNPPVDAISIENLRTHLVFTFSDTVPENYRKIIRIGITNSTNTTDNMLELGSYNHYLDLDLVGDANRVVDLKIDLTSLLKKDNVGFRTSGTPDTGDHTYIYVDFPIELYDQQITGEIVLWKADGLFTTTGIR